MIVMEMINGHALVISLMATALIASRVSRFFAPPLYDALSERYRVACAEAMPPAAEVQPIEMKEVEEVKELNNELGSGTQK